MCPRSTPLRDKITININSWTMKKLSHARRKTSIAAVLAGLVTFSASVFVLSRHTVKVIESMRLCATISHELDVSVLEIWHLRVWRVRVSLWSSHHYKINLYQRVISVVLALYIIVLTLTQHFLKCYLKFRCISIMQQYFWNI